MNKRMRNENFNYSVETIVNLSIAKVNAGKYVFSYDPISDGFSIGNNYSISSAVASSLGESNSIDTGSRTKKIVCIPSASNEGCIKDFENLSNTLIKNIKDKMTDFKEQLESQAEKILFSKNLTLQDLKSHNRTINMDIDSVRGKLIEDASDELINKLEYLKMQRYALSKYVIKVTFNTVIVYNRNAEYNNICTDLINLKGRVIKDKNNPSISRKYVISQHKEIPYHIKAFKVIEQILENVNNDLLTNMNKSLIDLYLYDTEGITQDTESISYSNDIIISNKSNDKEEDYQEDESKNIDTRNSDNDESEELEENSNTDNLSNEDKLESDIINQINQDNSESSYPATGFNSNPADNKN